MIIALVVAAVIMLMLQQRVVTPFFSAHTRTGVERAAA
jgi:hypothetical protein